MKAEDLMEKVQYLLETYTENVSAYYWIPAIHEDKHEKLSEDIVKLLKTKTNENKRSREPYL
tara:strand:- start:477 stop:662 length:186 start_codon:yes stop_codon:yes gene_type:complete